jgi:hypothetical protein
MIPWPSKLRCVSVGILNKLHVQCISQFYLSKTTTYFTDNLVILPTDTHLSLDGHGIMSFLLVSNNHVQQYFSYIIVIIFLLEEESVVPGENHRHSWSHGQNEHIKSHRVHLATSGHLAHIKVSIAINLIVACHKYSFLRPTSRHAKFSTQHCLRWKPTSFCSWIYFSPCSTQTGIRPHSKSSCLKHEFHFGTP